MSFHTLFSHCFSLYCSKLCHSFLFLPLIPSFFPQGNFSLAPVIFAMLSGHMAESSGNDETLRLLQINDRHTQKQIQRQIHTEDSRIISQMMCRYGINCQHFLVGWSCGHQDPMSPGGIFSSTEVLNIKNRHTHTHKCTTFICTVQARKPQQSLRVT